MNFQGEQEYYLFNQIERIEYDDDFEDNYEDQFDDILDECDEPYMSYDEDMEFFLEKENEQFLRKEDSYNDE